MRFRIDLKIFIFFAIFFFTKQLELYLYTMLFCFIHELGHLFTGIMLGIKPEKIEMTPFGFFLELRPNTIKSKTNRWKTNILIAIAGPMVNIILIFIILISNIYIKVSDIIVYINLLIFAFNMIPIYPLDGGRILNCILHIFYDNTKSDILVNKISNVCIIILTMISSVAIYYFKNIAILLIMCYLWALIIRENKRILLKRKIIELKK